MNDRSSTVTLSLVSHTNIGKTTLARTLLQREVGQVLDQAHVTLQNEQFTLLTTPGGLRLNLWDTPGFGNCHKLVKRLQGLSNPIGWIISQVWDRLSDRPFWCSQQAIQNVRDEADVVLYLVNATEDPSMAGYLQSELELLTWIDKPVIVLLNQTGLKDPAEQRRMESLWQRHWAAQEVMHEVLSLDAFTRCWVQEGMLWERIIRVLPETKLSIMRELVEAWRKKNQLTFRSSLTTMAQVLIETARDGETLAPSSSRSSRTTLLKRVIQAMDQRLGHRISMMTSRLIQLHGLSGEIAQTIQSRLEDVTIPGERKPWEEESFWGGLVSGAAAGFASDLATGGLSHGLFTIGGAILGAVGGTAYAKSQDTNDPSRISWVPDFLDRQTRDALLRYLAVTHCGRGRGDYADPREFPLFWRQAVEEAVSEKKTDLHQAWVLAKTQPHPHGTDEPTAFLLTLLEEMTKGILLKFYPEATPWIGHASPPENEA